MSTPASTPPSLFRPAPGPATVAPPPHSPADARTLLDLMYDGFYMLFLLKNKHAPADADTFRDKVKTFLREFEREADRLHVAAEDIYLSKYAFCALVDETVLTSSFRIREAWERQPLQVQFFGDQLAGENFFQRLEELRRHGAARVQVLEVFHMCLLLGFQGKYLLEGTEKLNYLTARLGDEIAHLKGRRAAFAPHWAPPDRISHALKNEVPLWVMGGVFALLGLAAFLGLRWSLDHSTRSQLAGYQQLVRLPPQSAHLTITLP
ncbi:DotU family type IV/VI secretion system protein [Caldimonas thermodepolymerans]|jgi:type VI secretion system protein ImpK|uniref:Type VI secretion system protein ImpK n=1 Tax=Caldimonas thermodepolymerans TaxID=215580 RepID=A0A2S5T690_9BURK|nr:type IVB secretion system protein IcmH/DotU [Caldimonas thermodepolymerans]PPE70398.1 type VI secretion system protein ImpK [Caldimonas thermodepolymerans]QPC30305.1 DotU family type IV/VI secretion system protein [Caldimonas thermodepolymerans]RDI00701.1 type VI secretion system protein ImpK [Caldimonas thermodepolymerans]TCP07020.1 type VI secretion system protein ImpK [Caldimonas thermodepolymerans]UZG43067.1 type IVB secretion system protein IcmH/DotU [Caldimonas thermodepolymerans]